MISPSGRAEAAAVKTQRNTTAGDRARAQTPANADELLKRLGLLGKRNGIYTERQLERKIRQERERWPEADEFSVSDEVRRYLLERQVEDLIIVSNLTPMQEIAFRLYAQGLGLRSTGDSRNQAPGHRRPSSPRTAESEGGVQAGQIRGVV